MREFRPRTFHTKIFSLHDPIEKETETTQRRGGQEESAVGRQHLRCLCWRQRVGEEHGEGNDAIMTEGLVEEGVEVRQRLRRDQTLLRRQPKLAYQVALRASDRVARAGKRDLGRNPLAALGHHPHGPGSLRRR